MPRKKTTVYIDEDLLRSAKVMAARTDRKDSEVFEAALRRYLGIELLERVGARSDLNDEEALDLAYAALREVRAERAARAERDSKAG